MKYLCIGIAVFLLAFPRAGDAAIIETGQDLERACRAPDELSACLTFLQAVHKTAKEIVQMQGPDARTIAGSCGPEKGIDTLPLSVWLRDAWYAYAARHPKHRFQRAAEAALMAIEEQWPCPTGASD